MHNRHVYINTSSCNDFRLLYAGIQNKHWFHIHVPVSLPPRPCLFIRPRTSLFALETYFIMSTLSTMFPFRLLTTLFAPIPSFHYVPALFNPPTTPLIHIYNFNLYFPLHCCAIGVFTTSLRYLSPILTLQV